MAAQMNTTNNASNLEEEFLKKMEEDGYRKKIQEWWFDDTLYKEDDSEQPGQIRTELKRYYAFIQVFYHENFRQSNAEIDKYLKGLIQKVENDKKYHTCEERERILRALVLGSAYCCLGQFKAERYQSAEIEHGKAIRYLEQDISLFEHTDSENADVGEEDFVIMLLFLLNKAQYFRDIAEKDALRVDACYWRAIMLFREIKNKIEKKQEKCKESQIEGIIARIYVSAWLNIAQVYRFQQENELTAKECIKLVSFCINSLEDKETKKKVREVVEKLPQMQVKDRECGFSVKKFEQENRNRVDYLFEDYTLQALLQLGISYRDCVDFNGSLEGNIWVRRAIGVFLVLGIVDRIKDGGKDESAETIEELLDVLQKSKLNPVDQFGSLMNQIKNLCTDNNGGEGKAESQLRNEDAKNNLAVCLKKLGYYTAAIAILTDVTLNGNKFAEYNLCKCYLESGLTEKAEIIKEYCYSESGNTRPVYVYPEEPAKSNYKWLFLYARYLFARKKFEQAEKLFSLIRKNRTIQWDSLELKAAYLEAQCQMNRGKNLSAIASLNNIHETLLKLDNERSKRRHEIRTEIDLGWCLVVEDRYKEALDVYRKLLIYLVWDGQSSAGSGEVGGVSFQKGPVIKDTLEKLKENIVPVEEPDDRTGQTYSMKWHAVSDLAQKQILHNLYDCWSYLHPKDPQKSENEVSNLIKEICELKGGTDIYMRFLQSLRKLNWIKREYGKSGKRDEWKELSDTFGEILKSRPLDTITYSCWVISKVNYCMQLSRRHKEFEEQKKLLLSGLVSSTTPITLKSYIEVAQIIRNRNGDDRFLNISRETKNKEGMELERAFLELFCHVNLLKNGTNQAFMNLMTNPIFHSIELVTRANLLASIVELYGDILQLKTQLRVTYADLEAFEKRERGSGTVNDMGVIICQYTKLSTLKGILPRRVKGVNGETVESEPRFRMSNAARMNDASEGTMFKKICAYMAQQKHEKVIQKYIDNSSGYKSADGISSYDSNVYIASFSMNRDNFGLWSNYADKERGCIIGFDKGFFDLVDKNYYSILDDEAEENALYRILYVDEHELFTGKDSLGIKSFKRENNNKTQNMDIETIKVCIPNILQKLHKIEQMLKDENLDTLKEADVIRAFIVDRLNEIRFLFKSVSYEYEEEMRMLRCSQNPEVGMSDLCDVPWLYINVEKRLDNLTLILGSRVDLQQVKELSVWAKSTGRVKQVAWSGLNRL